MHVFMKGQQCMFPPHWSLLIHFSHLPRLFGGMQDPVELRFETTTTGSCVSDDSFMPTCGAWHNDFCQEPGKSLFWQLHVLGFNASLQGGWHMAIGPEHFSEGDLTHVFMKGQQCRFPAHWSLLVHFSHTVRLPTGRHSPGA